MPYFTKLYRDCSNHCLILLVWFYKKLNLIFKNYYFFFKVVNHNFGEGLAAVVNSKINVLHELLVVINKAKW